MTYTVSSGTLNPTQLNSISLRGRLLLADSLRLRFAEASNQSGGRSGILSFCVVVVSSIFDWQEMARFLTASALHTVDWLLHYLFHG